MVVCLKQAKANILNWALRAMIYFKKSFLTKNIVSPQANICGSSPRHSLFLISPFSKFGTKSCPTQQTGGLILWHSSMGFSHFLNCANGTKLNKTPDIVHKKGISYRKIKSLQLNFLWPMFHFYFPWKPSKIFVFLIIFGKRKKGRGKTEQWPELS